MAGFIFIFLVVSCAFMVFNDARKAGLKTPWPFLLFGAAIIKPEFVFPAYFVYRLVGGPFKKGSTFKTSFTSSTSANRPPGAIDGGVHLCPKCGYESEKDFDVCPKCKNKLHVNAS